MKTLNGIDGDLGDFKGKSHAVNHAMFDIMAEIGEGKNGGNGSLWKCVGEMTGRKAFISNRKSE